MSQDEIQICIECGKEGDPPTSICDGEKLFALTERLIAERSLDKKISVRAVGCLGNCDERCRLAAISRNRWSWTLGTINPDKDYAFLQEFLDQWTTTPNGLIPKKIRSEKLIDKTLGRNPPLL